METRRAKKREESAEDLGVSELGGKDGRQEGPRPPAEAPCPFTKQPSLSSPEARVPRVPLLANTRVTICELAKGTGRSRWHRPARGGGREGSMARVPVGPSSPEASRSRTTAGCHLSGFSVRRDLAKAEQARQTTAPARHSATEAAPLYPFHRWANGGPGPKQPGRDHTADSRN